MKDKTGITITNAFEKILDESNCKPSKIRVVKGSKFYNRSMKLRLDEYSIKMYSANKEVKSVVAERFIRTLKDEIYKHMISQQI